MQRRALPTALALAKATDRTLVLPPLEWYDGQAQEYANTFRKQAQPPRFAKWSDLFDIDYLRKTSRARYSIDVIEAHELLGEGDGVFPTVGRALLNLGTSDDATKTAARAYADLPRPRSGSMPPPPPADDASSLALGGLLREVPCESRSGRSPIGLRGNLSWDGAGAAEAERGAGAAGSGELYTRRVRFDSLRCGAVRLRAEGAAASLRGWAADVQLAAIFDVGHHAHTVFEVEAGPDEGEAAAASATPAARAVGGTSHRGPSSLGASVRPNRKLAAEAARWVETLGASKYVAIHWRHGDYVAYSLLTPLARLVSQTRQALKGLGCADCPVFLMTNCRNLTALAELAVEIPSLRSYEPPSRFADEGPRLVIEQAIIYLP